MYNINLHSTWFLDGRTSILVPYLKKLLTSGGHLSDVLYTVLLIIRCLLSIISWKLYILYALSKIHLKLPVITTNLLVKVSTVYDNTSTSF